MKWNKNIPRPDNPTRKEVEEALENLDRSGVVMEYIDGGIYLDLDNDWIFKALEVVSIYGYEVPPFFNYSGGEGAHIKIAEKDEIKGESVQAVLGRKVHFEVVRAYASFPNLKTYGLENIFKINVQSAELHNIREELTGKTTPPNGKFFFVVLAVRKIQPLRSLGMKSDSAHEIAQLEKGNDEMKVDENEEEEEMITDDDEENDVSADAEEDQEEDEIKTDNEETSDDEEEDLDGNFFSALLDKKKQFGK